LSNEVNKDDVFVDTLAFDIKKLEDNALELIFEFNLKPTVTLQD
jgi:hypothetical protein